MCPKQLRAASRTQQEFRKRPQMKDGDELGVSQAAPQQGSAARCPAARDAELGGLAEIRAIRGNIYDICKAEAYTSNPYLPEAQEGQGSSLDARSCLASWPPL